MVTDQQPGVVLIAFWVSTSYKFLSQRRQLQQLMGYANGLTVKWISEIIVCLLDPIFFIYNAKYYHSTHT